MDDGEGVSLLAVLDDHRDVGNDVLSVSNTVSKVWNVSLKGSIDDSSDSSGSVVNWVSDLSVLDEDDSDDVTNVVSELSLVSVEVSDSGSSILEDVSSVESGVLDHDENLSERGEVVPHNSEVFLHFLRNLFASGKSRVHVRDQVFHFKESLSDRSGTSVLKETMDLSQVSVDNISSAEAFLQMFNISSENSKEESLCSLSGILNSSSLSKGG